MGNKNYVCVSCGQDFTRKYSAYRHNRHLHQEGATIVRMLDYIIGRTTGEYFAADPIAFRRKRREQATTSDRNNFPFVNVAHSRDELQHYETAQREDYGSNHPPFNETSEINPAQICGNSRSKYEEIESICSTLPNGTGQYMLKRIQAEIIAQNGREAVLDACLEKLNAVKASNDLFAGPEKLVKKEIPLLRHPDLWVLPHEAKSKLEEIEQTMYRLKINPPLIFEEIKRLGNAFRITGDLGTLTSKLGYLERYGKIK